MTLVPSEGTRFTALTFFSQEDGTTAQAAILAAGEPCEPPLMRTMPADDDTTIPPTVYRRWWLLRPPLAAVQAVIDTGVSVAEETWPL